MSAKTPLQRIGFVLEAIRANLEARGAKPGHESPDAFWGPGATFDTPHHTLVRQADRKLPDGRIVPGPWTAYPKDAAPGSSTNDAKAVAAAEAHEQGLLRSARDMARAFGIGKDGLAPGALLHLESDRMTTDLVGTARRMLTELNRAFLPISVVYAGQAPQAWGVDWALPTGPSTVVIAELWPSLPAPQIAAVVDAVIKRRRTQTVLVVSGSGWEGAGAREREQYGRLVDLARRSGMVGAW